MQLPIARDHGALGELRKRPPLQWRINFCLHV
jgi:hypothetical protein